MSIAALSAFLKQLKSRRRSSFHNTKRNGDTHNKHNLIKKIEEDEVQFWWSMLAISITEEDASADLLNNLISMWVTMRRFAVVSNWLEQYNMLRNKV